MQEQMLIVGGERRTGGALVPIRNPYTGSEIALVHIADAGVVGEAIAAADDASRRTERYSSYERSDILRSVASRLRSRKEEFSQCITAEAGKPVMFARAEVDRAITTFEFAAEEAKRVYGETLPLDVSPGSAGKQGIVNWFPIGIVLCITPFNFPLNLVAHKLAPAIAAGNSFILKPAPQTPLTSLLLGDVLLQSGFEKKGVNIVPASNEVAEILVTDSRIAMLSFTGSAHVGWMLKQRAGKKKVALELGGNAAVIVDATADIARAVARSVLGGYGYAGQVCIKVQRVIIHESVYIDFEKRFVDAVGKVQTGDPADAATIVGPLISENEARRVESWVQEAVSEGAVLLAGGKRNGSFYAPTVLKNVAPHMKICSEEVFGPVVTLEPFSSIDSAIEKVNSSRYGLQAGLFSNDHAVIQYMYKSLRVGGLIINDYPTFRVDNMPYGGVKDSGFGREGVRYAMEEMMEKKLLVL